MRSCKFAYLTITLCSFCFQFSLFLLSYPKPLMQFNQARISSRHFASQTTWNNQKILAEARSHMSVFHRCPRGHSVPAKFSNFRSRAWHAINVMRIPGACLRFSSWRNSLILLLWLFRSENLSPPFQAELSWLLGGHNNTKRLIYKNSTRF